MTTTIQHLLAAATPTTALTALVAGFALGLVHFGTLWWNAGWFAQGRPLAALVLQILRLALVTATFALAARLGAVPLLTATLGFLAARRLVLSRTRRLS